MKQEIFILILAGIFIFVNLYSIASIEGSSFIQNNLEDGTVEITNTQKSFSITGSNIGLGENNQINILDSEGKLTIKNSEGIVMTELSGLKTSEDVGNPSGYIRLDENGNVINFDGVANKNTAVKINKNQYSMTKDTRLTLKNDTATIKPAKAGDAFSFVRPSKNEKGEDDIALTSIELGENSLEIKESEKEATFSSESGFKINSLKIDKIGRGNPSISIDSQGKFSSYENAKLNFNNGLSSSSIKKVDLYYNRPCNLQGSYLCVEDKSLTFGSQNAQNYQVIEFESGNPFFNMAKSSDKLKITSEGLSEIEIIKDQISVIGSTEITNGNNLLKIDSKGNIKSEKLNSDFTKAPIEIFTKDKDGSSITGKLGDNKIIFDEEGNMEVVTLSTPQKIIESKKSYLIKRSAELYSPQKSLEFSKKELALDTPSSSYISYSDLSAEEEIAGIRIVYLNEKGSLDAAARSKTSVAGSSLMNAKFFVVCEGLGIDPNLSFDEMAKLLKEKSSDPNSNFYVTFGTRDKTGEPTGKKYGFGSQEVLNQMK